MNSDAPGSCSLACLLPMKAIPPRSKLHSMRSPSTSKNISMSTIYLR